MCGVEGGVLLDEVVVLCGRGGGFGLGEVEKEECGCGTERWLCQAREDGQEVCGLALISCCSAGADLHSLGNSPILDSPCSPVSADPAINQPPPQTPLLRSSPPS